MSLRRAWLPFVLFVVAFAAYVGVTRLAFRMPTNLFEAQACAFTPGEVEPDGQLRYAAHEAWWISFVRRQEYLSALSVGVAVAFTGYAIARVRQIGVAATSGAVAGGGLLVGLSLCFSCVAPAFAAVGLGLFANLGLALGAFPKELVALNSVALTTWGFLWLSRRTRTCPVGPQPILQAREEAV